MSTVSIKPNAKGLTNMEDLTLAQLKVIQIALRNHERKLGCITTAKEKQDTTTLLFEMDMYFTYAARRIAQKELIN